MHDTIRRWLVDSRFASDLHRYHEMLCDINLAHVIMLVETEQISREDSSSLIEAVEQVRGDPEALVDGSDTEDHYFAVERAVIELAGPTGGRMHIGRSRNDIGATLVRMALRHQLNSNRLRLLRLMKTVATLAADHMATVMPGYTHLRSAQPTTFGHYLSAVLVSLQRDWLRLSQTYDMLGDCPMGSVAFAGTSHPIDRDGVATALGFLQPSRNSLDAVASRDVCVQAVAAASIAASTLGRFVQDLYVWSTTEFDLIALGPDVTGTSSVMPQKRNPVVLERARAKVAAILGTFVSSLTALKGTGFMHSHDASIDATVPIWIAGDELAALFEVLEVTIGSLEVREENMLLRSREAFATSTEVADHLVRELGMPFRQAHKIVSVTVRSLGDRQHDVDAWRSALLEAADEERAISPALDTETLRCLIDPTASVGRRTSSGSPAQSEVAAMLGEVAEWLAARTQEVLDEMSRLDGARKRLTDRAERYRDPEQ